MCVVLSLSVFCPFRFLCPCQYFSGVFASVHMHISTCTCRRIQIVHACMDVRMFVCMYVRLFPCSFVCLVRLLRMRIWDLRELLCLAKSLYECEFFIGVGFAIANSCCCGINFEIFSARGVTSFQIESVLFFFNACILSSLRFDPLHDTIWDVLATARRRHKKNERKGRSQT